MFIKNFGLFWRRDEINWNPGRGAKGAFRLLGRQGANYPVFRLADFRDQQGIYILYGDHGSHYVGLTKKLGLGQRLKNHLTDGHANQWDRFSWFGFRTVLIGKNGDGLRKLREMAEIAVGSPNSVITDVEALLIRAMGLHNIAQPNFNNADQWEQVKAHEAEHFMSRAAA